MYNYNDIPSLHLPRGSQSGPFKETYIGNEMCIKVFFNCINKFYHISVYFSLLRLIFHSMTNRCVFHSTKYFKRTI